MLHVTEQIFESVRRLSYIITVPVALIVAVFAVANRHPVNLDLWPLAMTVTLPTYLVVLGAGLLGFVAGACVALISSGARRRRRVREARNRTAELGRSVARLRRERDEALATRTSEPAPTMERSLPSAR